MKLVVYLVVLKLLLSALAFGLLTISFMRDALLQPREWRF